MRAGKLKVVVYEVTHIASSVESHNALSAHDLASADIVLTTYDTLRVDFHRVRDDNSTSYKFRRPKKYEVHWYSSTYRIFHITGVCCFEIAKALRQRATCVHDILNNPDS